MPANQSPVDLVMTFANKESALDFLSRNRQRLDGAGFSVQMCWDDLDWVVRSLQKSYDALPPEPIPHRVGGFYFSKKSGRKYVGTRDAVTGTRRLIALNSEGGAVTPELMDPTEWEECEPGPDVSVYVPGDYEGDDK